MIPDGIWGAATSAHQVEGGNQRNDWWAWEAAGKVPERSNEACAHYERFRDDFRLARSLGHTAHRFSLEWSRLEPREGEWNEDAFRHYEKVFEALEAEGLEPVVTLHHFTNPLWFTEKGGWLRSDSVEKFSEYVQRVVDRFGRHARLWITFNEPQIYAYQSYFLGIWPPGEKSFEKALQVLKNLVRAHIEAYRILHRRTRNAECYVSLAQHVIAFTPCRPHSFLDRWNLTLREWFINQLLFRSLHSGFLFYPGIFFEKLPARRTLDFLGINYYSRDFVRFSGWRGMSQFGAICSKDHHAALVQEVNDLGWEIYPAGLFHVISGFRALGLPILITENGVCTKDDRQRERFIEGHLVEMERARKQGVPIFGYFYWSLVDNFEWAEGFRPRFGIVEVDYATQERRVRPSAETLRRCCGKIFQGTKERRNAERIV